MITKKRIENALASTLKRKARGNKPGPILTINKKMVFKKRNEGYSIRQIASLTSCSPARIHQILKAGLNE